MPDETRHESADLEDYSVQEPADSLTGEPGEPGDDPLDRGVAPPERWSAEIRSGSDGGEQGVPRPAARRGRARHRPRPRRRRCPKTATTTTRPTSTSTASCSTTARTPGRAGWWPRTRAPTPTTRTISSRRDVGIDGGAASAEEAAIHVVEDDDTDIRSGD